MYKTLNCCVQNYWGNRDTKQCGLKDVRTNKDICIGLPHLWTKKNVLTEHVLLGKKMKVVYILIMLNNAHSKMIHTKLTLSVCVWMIFSASVYNEDHQANHQKQNWWNNNSTGKLITNRQLSIFSKIITQRNELYNMVIKIHKSVYIRLYWNPTI